MRRLALATAGLVLLAATATGQFRAYAASPFDESQQKAIQEIVRSYLIENPGVLEEVIEALRAQKEIEATEARQTHLSTLYGPQSPYADYGFGTGDVVIVEFMDYNCPYCRKAYADLREFADADKNVVVRFVEFPVLGPSSLTASRAAIAARQQGKYMEFHDAMMRSSVRFEDEASVFAVAEQVGIDIEQLKKDMEAPEVDAFIESNIELAESIGVQGTPAFLVGDVLIPGAPENLTQEVAQAVTKTREEGCAAC